MNFKKKDLKKVYLKNNSYKVTFTKKISLEFNKDNNTLKKNKLNISKNLT